MLKILLVEPEYNNKYPPIGLMKIASYHRGRGDYVEFYKGKAPYTSIINFDRVYITTLFTFYYDITVQTILHYLDFMHKDSVFVGGISATLLHDELKKDLGIKNIISGQLVNSSLLGYSDSINIDDLPLDYDILDDVSYKYPSGDNIFIYTTRGCLRGCEFCAVTSLEPEFKDTNSIIPQIESIRKTYGDKRNVLIMDNNILYSSKLNRVIEDLNTVGYKINSSNYIEPNYVDLMINKINRRKKLHCKYDVQMEELINYLVTFSNTIKRSKVIHEYNELLDCFISSESKYKTINLYKKDIINIVERYRFKKKLQRYVDFNQGLDARLLTSDKMEILSKIPIKPFRLAYDNAHDKNIYESAFKSAYSNGVRYFSNYILYNYKDKPSDLWERLHHTILIYEKKTGIQAFSFPMKYVPVSSTNREFIGSEWNKKYLSAINVIINVTKGVVVKEKDFFYEAFGSNKKEYFEILTMPNEFIKYRRLFKKHGYIKRWFKDFKKLNAYEKKILLKYLCGNIDKTRMTNRKVLSIIQYYSITKNMMLNDKQLLAQ